MLIDIMCCVQWLWLRQNHWTLNIWALIMNNHYGLGKGYTKKITRIVKAALHKLPGKSSLNDRSVWPLNCLSCLSRVLWLSWLSCHYRVLWLSWLSCLSWWQWWPWRPWGPWLPWCPVCPDDRGIMARSVMHKIWHPKMQNLCSRCPGWIVFIGVGFF